MSGRECIAHPPTHARSNSTPDIPRRRLTKQKPAASVPDSPNKLTKMAPKPSFALPARSSGFHVLKRVASMDSPREVPLPSPSLSSPGHVHSSLSAFPFPDPAQLQLSPASTELPSVFDESTANSREPSPLTSAAPSNIDIHQPNTTILPYPRPYSMPEDPSPPSRPSLGSRKSTLKPLPSPSLFSETAQATPTNEYIDNSAFGLGSREDRESSASLPLPSNIPFKALPRVGDKAAKQAKRKTSVVDSGMIVNRMTRATALPMSSLPNTRHSVPSSSSSQKESLSTVQKHLSAGHPPPTYRSNSSTATSTALSLGNPGASVGRAVTLHSASPSSGTHRSGTASLYQSVGLPPPEPPTILDGNDFPVTPVALASLRTDSSGSGGSAPSIASSSSSSGGSEMSRSGSESRSRAPYMPFLSPLPAPADSWIEVETLGTEYRLHIRLPGFKRDGITLATKKRRILHVVADSWDDSTSTLVSSPSSTSSSLSSSSPPVHNKDSSTSTVTPSRILSEPPQQQPRYGGGHFERRISFGYDADLVQVRAEFDGEMLRIVVPRREPPISWGRLS